MLPTTTESELSNIDNDSSEELENDIQFPILEKLSIFKNIVANRDKKKNHSLLAKPQMHPVHDIIHHAERKIEKKDHAKMLDATEVAVTEKKDIPDFKPTLPDVFINKQDIKLPDGYVAVLKKDENDFYEEYYNDENLYDDYMQSNTMTSYLIEKVQDLHDWIVSDPDFEVAGNYSKKIKSGNDFGQLLKALNESLIEGNVSIVMNKLKDIYFGDNYTSTNHSRTIISSNSTDLLSFGILTLDVMLLHNIQLMAWENQEGVRNKMLKDPDVFAFNALFLDPSKVESKQNEIYNTAAFSKRQNVRQESVDEFDVGKNLLENVLEVGMSTARAAIHLGRAYKNTKMVLNQISNRDALNSNIQQQLSRDIDGNTHALNHLSSQQATQTNAQGTYTELDCVWLLYCRNLAATAKLNAPLATMARINGIALRMLTGELPADKALDTMVYEALTGWTELRCNDMFPRCSNVNPATVVLDTILQPMRKSQANRV
ncbi:uncharacterized protein LOC134660116 [Cydia amplana]|uniref:uncharacterized protein LOC134660116 n=1 Tax=Cydia amplana TaxID=1869771 RepID=UPI002FE5F6C5